MAQASTSFCPQLVKLTDLSLGVVLLCQSGGVIEGVEPRGEVGLGRSCDVVRHGLADRSLKRGRCFTQWLPEHRPGSEQVIESLAIGLEQLFKSFDLSIKLRFVFEA